MNLKEDIELLESLFVELDPLADGFTGVLLEVQRRGDRYVLMETATTTGNLLLRFWDSRTFGALRYACATMLTTTPFGSRTKNRRTPHGSSVSGCTIS